MFAVVHVGEGAVKSPCNLLSVHFTDLLMICVVSDFSSEPGNNQLQLQLFLLKLLQ